MNQRTATSTPTCSTGIDTSNSKNQLPLPPKEKKKQTLPLLPWSMSRIPMGVDFDMSMPAEYPLLKALIIMVGSLVVLPFLITWNQVSSTLQHQNLCFVGVVTPNTKITTATSDYRADLFGTYKSFGGSSYYYTQTPNDLDFLFESSRSKWWSITTLASTMLSPKVAWLQSQTTTSNNKMNTLHQQHQDAPANSIQWDQSHMNVEPPPSSPLNNHYSSSKNRWCLLPGTNLVPTTTTQQQQQSDVELPATQEVVAAGSLRQEEQQQQQQLFPFQICTPPQPSIMSNGDDSPFFVELPLTPPPFGIWNKIEIISPKDGTLIDRGDHYLHQQHQRQQKVQPIRVQCHTPPSSIYGLAQGNRHNFQENANINLYNNNGNTHMNTADGNSRTTTNANAYPLLNNQSEQERLQADSILTNTHRDNLQQAFEAITHSSTLFGTYLVIFILFGLNILPRIILHCHKYHRRCSHRGRHSNNIANINTQLSSPLGIGGSDVFAGGPGVLLFAGTNIASCVQLQLHEASIPGTLWNIVWLYWIGTYLEKIWGTILYLGVQVSIVTLLALIGSFEKPKKQYDPNQPRTTTISTNSGSSNHSITSSNIIARNPVEVNNDDDHSDYSGVSASSNDGDEKNNSNAEITKTPQGYMWVVVTLSICLAQEEPMLFMYKGTVQMASISVISLFGNSSYDDSGGIYINAVSGMILVGHWFLGSVVVGQTEKKRYPRKQFLLYYFCCVILGVTAPNCLECMAAPQWIVPTLLVAHLWWSSSPKRARASTSNRRNDSRNSGPKYDKSELDHLIIMRDDDDDNNMNSTVAETTATSVSSISSTASARNAKVLLTGNAGAISKNNVVKYLRKQQNDEESVFSVPSVNQSAVNISSATHLMPQQYSLPSLSSYTTNSDSQFRDTSKRGCCAMSTQLFQKFGMGTFLGIMVGLSIISSRILDWTLVVGHIMTTWLYIGASHFHHMPETDKYGSWMSTTSAATNTKRISNSNSDSNSANLWSLYHLWSASIIVVVDCMTLAGWHHAQVAIFTHVWQYSEFPLPSEGELGGAFGNQSMLWDSFVQLLQIPPTFNFVRIIIACQVGIHFMALIITASSSRWKQSTFAVPGYFIWEQARIVGEEGCEWFLVLIYGDD